MFRNYQFSYNNAYTNQFLTSVWQAPTLSNAVLVMQAFKWLLYGIVIGIATIIITPFLALYGVRISNKQKEEPK